MSCGGEDHVRRIFRGRIAPFARLRAEPIEAFGFCSTRLATGGTIVALTRVAGTAETQNAVANGDTRTISMVHQHTGESATITFKRDGRYDQAALDQLSWLLRDWRENESTKMDPRLFDTVWEAQRAIGSTQPLRVVCGYRSPKTNGMLRRRSSAVAEHSQHMLGKAMDFFMTDASIDDIRAAGVRMQRGGVGWYPRSGSPFVHLDVGSVRAWPRLSREQLARIFPDGKTVHLPADGKPFSGYEEARAEILARGGTVLGYTAMAQADQTEDGPGLKGFFAGLFGGDSSSAPLPAVTPGTARRKATIAVASADPDDATGAKQALAFAAPNSSDALREAMLRREGRDLPSAKSMLAVEDKGREPAITAPLPPRRPSEFASITAGLSAPLTVAHTVQVAALGNAVVTGIAKMRTELAAAPRAPLVPADAAPRDQVRALFDASVEDATKPASRATPVRLALAQTKPEAMPRNVFDDLSGAVRSRFSPHSPGDDLSASRFSGSTASGATRH